ncbi:WXG100 family type VII secretion target [Actinotalea fermentans]|uniref:WXG100 family type VII secretion target n=1 Tax=Actinotalea fermentans TaxID=43671 RepID=A0A511Z0E0_9CELL|nr:hypothetical protein [Actinotalea fermentans]KGM15270.1 hypothetical protein N867_10390 [Actinotalea fermentans ATCC 43279 = JCM 9966 = DSM 3133]GEN80899.1 hypothetical protein AFE02nite_26330 [Actinotalea fermentans]
MTTGDDRYGPDPSCAPYGNDIACQLTYEAIEELSAHWEETAAVLDEQAGRVAATGSGWSPAVAGAVSRFAEQWREDLAGLATGARGKRDALTGAVADFREADAQAARDWYYGGAR